MNLPFATHVLICTGPRCGDERQSFRVRQEFRREFVRQAVPASVKETQCICFGLCSHGPNVIVYPAGVVYSGVRPKDVADIVREHLVQGRVVERLLFKKKAAPEPRPDPETCGPDDPLPG